MEPGKGLGRWVSRLVRRGQPPFRLPIGLVVSGCLRGTQRARTNFFLLPISQVAQPLRDSGGSGGGGGSAGALRPDSRSGKVCGSGVCQVCGNPPGPSSRLGPALPTPPHITTPNKNTTPLPPPPPTHTNMHLTLHRGVHIRAHALLTLHRTVAGAVGPCPAFYTIRLCQRLHALAT
jgi:hypothetical protein